jgi:hypothetical protein
MRFIRSGVVAATAFALALPAAPVFAGGWGGSGVSAGIGYGSGYRGHRGRWRHRDRVDAGDVIAGIAIIGVIAAIASSGSKTRRNRTDSADRRRVDQSIVSEDQAVDACADAAQRQGGEAASVREILAVDRTTDGWDVEGTIEQRDGWRDSSGDRRRFTCAVRQGEIDAVFIDAGVVASR